MKIVLTLLIILGFIGICVQSFKNDKLQKAFVKIAEALGDRNHEVALVMDDFSRESMGSIASAAMAAIPHKVVQFENTRRLFLNTEAFVLLESVA